MVLVEKLFSKTKEKKSIQFVMLSAIYLELWHQLMVYVAHVKDPHVHLSIAEDERLAHRYCPTCVQ